MPLFAKHFHAHSTFSPTKRTVFFSKQSEIALWELVDLPFGLFSETCLIKLGCWHLKAVWWLDSVWTFGRVPNLLLLASDSAEWTGTSAQACCGPAVLPLPSVHSCSSASSHVLLSIRNALPPSPLLWKLLHILRNPNWTTPPFFPSNV